MRTRPAWTIFFRFSRLAVGKIFVAGQKRGGLHLAALLEHRHGVIQESRRGRGDSGVVRRLRSGSRRRIRSFWVRRSIRRAFGSARADEPVLRVNEQDGSRAKATALAAGE